MLYVITGPPASGKTTWVMKHARPSDIVIDYDRIAVALAGPNASSHDHPIVVKRVAHKARYAAIAEALDRIDQADVYLIHSMPSEHNMARYMALDAQIVTVNPGRDQVEHRCRALRPQLLAAVGRWYAWHTRQQTRAREQSSAPPATASTTLSTTSGAPHAARSW